jgi:hypothetical protein
VRVHINMKYIYKLVSRRRFKLTGLRDTALGAGGGPLHGTPQSIVSFVSGVGRIEVLLTAPTPFYSVQKPLKRGVLSLCISCHRLRSPCLSPLANDAVYYSDDRGGALPIQECPRLGP